MALQLVAEDVDPDTLYGPYEAKTLELAEIVGVSASTVSKWAQDNLITPHRTCSLGGGRPANVFDLRTVRDDMDSYEWPQAEEKYLPALDAEIGKRAAARIEAGVEDPDVIEADSPTEQAQANSEPLPEALIETLRNHLAELRADIGETQNALAKLLLQGDEALFTLNETAAMHAAIDGYRAERGER